MKISYIFGNMEQSVFTFLYAQFTSVARGLLYFKFPPTWPKLAVSTMFSLIPSMILTDILDSPHKQWNVWSDVANSRCY